MNSDDLNGRHTAVNTHDTHERLVLILFLIYSHQYTKEFLAIVLFTVPLLTNVRLERTPNS